MDAGEAKRLRELEAESAKVKKLLAEVTWWGEDGDRRLAAMCDYIRMLGNMAENT